MTFIGGGVFLAWLVAIFAVAALVAVGCAIAIVRDSRRHTVPATVTPAEHEHERVPAGV
jgi:hypothetical protein